MKFRVFLSEQAERFYAKLQRNVRVRVGEALLSLETQPLGGKRLHGELRENYSLRVGKVRVVYSVLEKDKTVYVIALGLREAIYKQSSLTRPL